MPSSTLSAKLENHLTLHAWLNHQFDYKTTRDLLDALKTEEEGFRPDGRSAICEALMSNARPTVAEQLLTYDANIRRHLGVINRPRTQPIVLRYFQYLALLYTEIYLDWKFNRRAEFLLQLNAFVQSRNNAKAPGDPQDSLFEDTDLEKLAFWMATGAGKTLLMHINYYQYLHYSKAPLDHIILITPNEGLTEQHLRELTASDIPSERFRVDGRITSGQSTHARNAVQVIEITKLAQEKTTGGASVPVEAFEGNNLIFVDEGHKGSGGEVWRKYREALAETGFTFEYSATFGQALSAAKNADLIQKYGKAIAFDYSYRYFYSDGYGKNFRILNIKYDEETQTETLLVANLLSFYEQRCFFRQNPQALRDYGLDSPLWAFVGSRVNAVYTEKHRKRSDILNVIRFLHRFLKNESNWAVRTIAKIRQGHSGIADETGTDVFANRFSYLQKLGRSPAETYTHMLTELFHTDTGGALHLCDLKNAQGEIGLKATNGTDYFGLIYIGDTSSFKKLVHEENADIVTGPEDVITDSLFTDINTPTSPVTLLIGAKKFIEGWDSWRVTAMGLLNIGRNEGSQIIQLFGRGVRLRGKGMSLKRSAALEGEHPDNLALLETLNIFAVRANFMAQFRDYLTREGVPSEEPVQLEIPIETNKDLLKAPLFVPEVPPYTEAAKGECVPLTVNPKIYITHQTQNVEILQSSTTAGIQGGAAHSAIEQATIPTESLDLLNWESIYLQLIEYKHEKQFHPLVFDTETLKHILDPGAGTYHLSIMDESEVRPTSLAEVERLEQLALTLLRKYIAKFYSTIRKQWSENRMRLGTLDENDTNFTNWRVFVPRNRAPELEPRLTQLVEDGKIYGPGVTEFPNIYTEHHLYQPLLTEDKGKDSELRTTPPALKDSERCFVKDLCCYLRKYDLTAQVVLLRNQSRGRGIGFYQNEGFYPDFILWILEGDKQRIVFIEPHGMVHEPINEHNEKIRLFERLRKISHERFRGEHVQMDAFTISKTNFPLMQKKWGMDKETFGQWHILFRDPTNPKYLAPIFRDD